MVKLDTEYSTTWWDECKYLMNEGISYSYVKKVNGVTVWKFEKNAKLFETLAKFYRNVYSRRSEGNDKFKGKV